MAATMQADDLEPSDVVIYIMPQRIQKSMLQDIKNGVKRKNLCVCENYGDGVTHIVTQYTNREQVLHQLRRDGAELQEDDNLEDVKVVSLAWLSACLKAGKVVAVEDRHLIKFSSVEQDALETLEKHAEFRSDNNDYSRALAFRRASCVLKSLPFRVGRLSQVEGVKDVGGHALKVIQSILEEGVCEEVQQVTDEWFLLMKEFTSVFGVGPATAKKWIDRGWRSIEEVRASNSFSKDERVHWGLAFHEDLTSPVSVTEADRFVQIVKREAEKILPGVIVALTGGFRRGKQCGHDVDILLSHSREGEETGLLPTLLQALHRQDLVLMGRREASTYTPDCLTSDSKLLAMRGQLDHFEKWLGICKFENTDQSTNSRDSASIASGMCAGESTECRNTDKRSCDPKPATATNTQKGGCMHQKNDTDLDQNHPSDIHCQGACRQDSEAHRKLNDKRKHGSGGDSASEPKPKQPKTSDRPHSPFLLARSERSWKARRVDFIVSPYSQYYYALVGWTGNKHFNRDLRMYAQKELHMKLTSHGLWDFEKQRDVPARSEAEVFDNLKLVYKEPSDRNC